MRQRAGGRRPPAGFGTRARRVRWPASRGPSCGTKISGTGAVTALEATVPAHLPANGALVTLDVEKYLRHPLGLGEAADGGHEEDEDRVGGSPTVALYEHFLCLSWTRRLEVFRPHSGADKRLGWWTLRPVRLRRPRQRPPPPHQVRAQRPWISAPVGSSGSPLRVEDPPSKGGVWPARRHGARHRALLRHPGRSRSGRGASAHVRGPPRCPCYTRTGWAGPRPWGPAGAQPRGQGGGGRVWATTTCLPRTRMTTKGRRGRT